MIAQSAKSMTSPALLREILLDYLQISWVAGWPGVDGITKEDVLSTYHQASVAGKVPNRHELGCRHPELIAEIQSLFTSKGWLENDATPLVGSNTAARMSICTLASGELMAKAANRLMLLAWILGILSLTTSNSSARDDDKKVDLKVGDAVPTFETRDDQDKPWNLADLVGKNYLVIYFYPGDFTPGCTAQAKSFRDNMDKLMEKGVAVIGISGDAVLNHQLFKKAQKLNFTLLADENGSIAKKFGVPVGPAGQVKTKGVNGQEIVLKRGVTAARWTFLIGKDGKIALKNTKVSPAQDSKRILEFVEHLQK